MSKGRLPEEERVREEIRLLNHDRLGCGTHECPHWQVDCFNCDWVVLGGLCPRMIDAIFSLVEIRADDQGLPENPNRLERVNEEKRTRQEIEAALPEVEYWQAQRDMLKPDSEGKHFIKVLPNPKKE